MIILAVFATLVVSAVASGADPALAPDDLLAQGYLEEAQREYEAMAQSNSDDARALEHLGFITFLRGDYERAVTCFSRTAAADPSKQKLLAAYTAFAHYQRRDFKSCLNSLRGVSEVNLLNREQIAYMSEHPPYRIVTQAEKEVLPFEALDPLPVVRISINDKELYAIIDTGAAQLIVDAAFALHNGVKCLAQDKVDGAAGGKAAFVEYGVADSVALGCIRLADVPVQLADLNGIANNSDIGQGKGRRQGEQLIRPEAIVGTELLMQFTPTLDYLNRSLVLRVGGADTKREPTALKTPFYIDGIHGMYAQCRINQKPPVLMYFDSGLADEQGACLVLSGAALGDLGLTKPREYHEGMGLGGPVRSGYVDVDSLSLGNMTITGQKATYQEGFEGSLMMPAGYKTYGLVSHNFLKRFRWTIDFKNRTFLFER